MKETNAPNIPKFFHLIYSFEEIKQKLLLKIQQKIDYSYFKTYPLYYIRRNLNHCLEITEFQ